MCSDTTAHTNKNNPAVNALQPVIYGVLSDHSGGEIDLGELLSRLISQWKLILAITAGGCLLAVLLAVLLPKTYLPAVTVSMPSSDGITPIVDINTILGGSSITDATMAKLKKSGFSEKQISTLNALLGGNNAIPATPEDIFRRYFNLLRSGNTLANYLTEKQYLKKLYPDSDKPASTLFARLLKDYSVEILEPQAQVRGGYVSNPERVKVSLKVKDEPIGVSLLNGYVDYVNHQLITTLQENAKKVIDGRIKILGDQIATQREQAKQSRLLTIKKIENDNARSIAMLQEQIAASVEKAASDRKTKIADATEALKLAKAMGLINPSTLDLMAKKDMKEGSNSGTNVTVVDKQSIPLYMYGTKYLNTLIQTLKNRKGDAVFMNNVNDLEEKIHILKNDKTLMALKNRQSDDPWIEGLSDELAKIEDLKDLKPNFSQVPAYTLDTAAIISDKPVKPNIKLIVVLGFVLSLFVAIFAALIVGSRNRDKQIA